MAAGDAANAAPASLTRFLRARLDEDEEIARAAACKRYPRWRVWLRRMLHGI
jgi:hypothetical protein